MSVSKGIGRRLSVIAAAVFLVSALAPGVVQAAPGGGNSAAAHVCQKGGWQELRTVTGGTFKNAGQCTSYAAQGGQFQAPPDPFYTQYVEICAEYNGLFEEGTNHWLCRFSSVSGTTLGMLFDTCADAGGVVAGYADGHPTHPFLALCTFP